jgi:hypothetical protein
MHEENDSRLVDLSSRLVSKISVVEIRGDGASRFLYVTGNGKSAEVSMHKGKFWVEFWGSLDEDAQPMMEAFYESIQSVEAALQDWLL